MSRTVASAGLFAAALLGLGLMSAQAAPVSSSLAGLTNAGAGVTEQASWRRQRMHYRPFYRGPGRHWYQRRWW